jgi:hypothetical protein
LAGRLTDTVGGKPVVRWNPVPFDPYAGGYRAGSEDPPHLVAIRDFLSQLLTDLAFRFLNKWRADVYLDIWQRNLTKRLQDLYSDTAFWKWLDANGAEILAVDPSKAALLELHACVTECERIGLFAGRPA